MISLLSTLGITCIINAKEQPLFMKGATICFPEIDEIVPFANRFDHVIGIKCGLTELISAETTTHVTLITDKYAQVEITYPFIDKRKISYLRNENFRDTGFPAIDTFINSILRSYHPYIDKCREFTKNLKRHYNFPNNIRYFFWANREQAFDDIGGGTVDKFCDVQYSLNFNNGFLICYIESSLDEQYEIYATLTNVAKNNVVSRLYKLTQQPLMFEICESGVYNIFIKIFYNTINKSCRFSTRNFICIMNEHNDLKLCDNYYAYIGLLCQLRQDLIIIIASKDAHTNDVGTKRLFLEALGVKHNTDAKFRFSYIVIINSGSIMAELESANETITYSCLINSLSIDISSSGFNVNNDNKTDISIKIDGNERAVNSRGLNFVVINKHTNLVIDSVSFDTYSTNNTAKRLSIP